jgi:hypothetical protein
MNFPGKNWLYFVVIFAASVAFSVFVGSLIGANQSDLAGALGDVVGGIIGALGAGLAVYLTLEVQKQDEASKVSAAIVAEISGLSVYPVKQLGVCFSIYRGQAQEYRDLAELFAAPVPVIYPAVAADIARISNATLVITFYGQFDEAQSILRGIARNKKPGDPVDFQSLTALTILLILQCKTARSILKDPLSSYLGDKVLARKVAGAQTLVSNYLAEAEELFRSFDPIATALRR